MEITLNKGTQAHKNLHVEKVSQPLENVWSYQPALKKKLNIRHVPLGCKAAGAI